MVPQNLNAALAPRILMHSKSSIPLCWWQRPTFQKTAMQLQNFCWHPYTASVDSRSNRQCYSVNSGWIILTRQCRNSRRSLMDDHISYFSHCCDQTPEKMQMEGLQLKGSGPPWQGTHGALKSLAIYCFYGQKEWAGCGLPSRLTTSDSLAPVRLHLLRFYNPGWSEALVLRNMYCSCRERFQVQFPAITSVAHN